MEKREVGYQSALMGYSQDFQPGLTRKEVEDRLRSKGASFGQIWTSFGGRRESDYADIVKIGEESAPWYCSEAYVYIALEFSAVEEHSFLYHHLAKDSDVLKRVEIFRPLTGCL